MKKIIANAVFVLVFGLVTQILQAQGNLVVNGGFENISNGTNVNGWTLTGNCYPDSKNGDPLPCLQMYGTAGAGQSINSLTPGVTYFVTGDYEVGQTFGFDFGVTIDGIKMFEVIDSTNLNWQSFNFSYTAVSSTAAFDIFLSSQGNELFFADNIYIYLVPEPSTEILLGFGGILLLVFLSRRRWNHFQ